uniref:Uncharacterized protein n=1 Tax=Knipowitschia caucasica TaxID=637954 RepID=A0AAV2L2K7_KNICA
MVCYSLWCGSDTDTTEAAAAPVPATHSGACRSCPSACHSPPAVDTISSESLEQICLRPHVRVSSSALCFFYLRSVKAVYSPPHPPCSSPAVLLTRRAPHPPCSSPAVLLRSLCQYPQCSGSIIRSTGSRVSNSG